MMSDHPNTWPVSPSDNGERRRLCLGGSFNPIHVGHLITARAAAEARGLDGVRLIPASGNPQKATADLAPAAHRLAWCRLAVANDPFFVVDPIEFHRPPPSYTFDTVDRLWRGERVPWLVGTDLLATLHTWHRFDELLDRIEFVVMRRAGHPIDLDALDPRVARIATAAVDVPQIAISSTAIRRRLRAGQSISYLVPDAVAEALQSTIQGPPINQ